jgi:beta-1,4-N-acetylglucosaminyltransferase
MIFLTVGTQFPFDRLVQTVDLLFDEGIINDEVFAQIGDSSYQPRHFEVVASLEKKDFDARFQQAAAVISHAGMGTITMALDHGKPLLAMPRRKRYGEVVNDHQEALALKFEALGHILVAREEKDLRAKVVQLQSFVPQPRQAQPDVVARRIARFLETLDGAQDAP